MNTEQDYQARVLANIPPMVENDIWRAIDPRDRHRIECENSCGEDAAWITRQGNLCVCNYHRFILEIMRIVDALAVQNPDFFKMSIREAN